MGASSFTPGKFAEPAPQVTHVVLKSGEKIEADLVVSGVGAKPMLDLYQGQVDTLDDKPGGIKVSQAIAAVLSHECTATDPAHAGLLSTCTLT